MRYRNLSIKSKLMVLAETSFLFIAFAMAVAYAGNAAMQNRYNSMLQKLETIEQDVIAKTELATWGRVLSPGFGLGLGTWRLGQR